MTSRDAAKGSPLAPVRARLTRLATDPRVQLFSDGRGIARELIDALDELDSLRDRVAALERGLASMVRPAEDCDS